jgi:hypothetical protein
VVGKQRNTQILVYLLVTYQEGEGMSLTYRLKRTGEINDNLAGR